MKKNINKVLEERNGGKREWSMENKSRGIEMFGHRIKKHQLREGTKHFLDGNRWKGDVEKVFQ